MSHASSPSMARARGGEFTWRSAPGRRSSVVWKALCEFLLRTESNGTWRRASCPPARRARWRATAHSVALIVRATRDRLRRSLTVTAAGAAEDAPARFGRAHASTAVGAQRSFSVSASFATIRHCGSIGERHALRRFWVTRAETRFEDRTEEAGSIPEHWPRCGNSAVAWTIWTAPAAAFTDPNVRSTSCSRHRRERLAARIDNASTCISSRSTRPACNVEPISAADRDAANERWRIDRATPARFAVSRPSRPGSEARGEGNGTRDQPAEANGFMLNSHHAAPSTWTKKFWDILDARRP